MECHHDDGGLFTQVEIQQERIHQEGLDAAVDNFQRAARTFQNFLNAMNSNLGPETLQLMCGKAREFNKTELSPDFGFCLELV